MTDKADRSKAMAYAATLAGHHPGCFGDDCNLSRAFIEVSEELRLERKENEALIAAASKTNELCLTQYQEITQLKAENERLVAALHPGPMPDVMMRPWIERGSDDKWHDFSSEPGTAERFSWCLNANRYESVTGRKLP